MKGLVKTQSTFFRTSHIANHIVAKGIEKILKKLYPSLNLLYLDIDGGLAEVNLQNRLYFMIDYPTR